MRKLPEEENREKQDIRAAMDGLSAQA